MPNSVPQSDSATGTAAACPIAIVGIGCLFPKADGVESYWSNIKRGVDAISDIPATHWKPEAYFDSDPAKPDMTYAKRGGFIDPVDFNPLHHGITPNNLEATDTTQLLGLMVAEQALRDANYETGRGTGDGRPFNRDRTSIILGVTGTLELVIPLGARLGHPIWRKALDEAGVDKATADDVVERIANGYVPWQENSFPGLLGNVAAGRIANRFDLGGSNCVVDAACASSLSAIHMATMELQTGRMDMVLTGGLDTFNDIFMYMCFSKTPALSPTGNSKPFSADGDGTILGEGLGIVALKRLDDAIRDGDKIYCVIKGIGSSSDGKGNAIYAPSAAGQVKCLTSAYREAGVSPRTIELIEAHGTGTKVGDGVEIKALRQVFENSSEFKVQSSELQASESITQNSELRTLNFLPRTAVGSVKSMIGHTKAAAGVAGLIKAALAVHHKVLPPTIKVSQPLDVVKPGESPVYLNTERRPWLPRKEHPRRAGVSAFGFGGSNFHCVLEEVIDSYSPPAIRGQGGAGGGLDQQQQVTQKNTVHPTIPQPLPKREGSTNYDHSNTILIAPFSADSLDALRTDLKSFADVASKDWVELRSITALLRASFDAKKSHRLVLVIERDRTDIAKLIASAQRLLDSQNIARASSPDGAYYANGVPTKLAFLFPGQGSQYAGMLRDLACDSPLVLNALAHANDAFTETDSGQRLSDLIYPVPVFDEAPRKASEEMLRQTQHAQPAIGAVSVGALRVLESFNVKASATAGHSFGELVALHAAGRIDETSLHKLAHLRGSLMAQAGSALADRGTMLAVIASADAVEKLLRESKLEGVVIANRNSPTQMVLSGSSEQIQRAATACEQRGLRAKKLPVSAAFHSSLVADAQVPFAQGMADIEFATGTLPVYANTTGDIYPSDAKQARDLLAGQLAKPVDFIGMIEKMFAAGIDTFIEMGPKSTLTSLVKSILGQRSHIALSIDQSAGKRTGEFDLASLLAQLAALGHEVDLKQWDHSFKPVKQTGKKPAMTVKLSGANYVKERPSKPRRETTSYSPPFQRGAGGSLDQQQNETQKSTSRPTLPQPLPKREGSLGSAPTHHSSTTPIPDTRHPTPALSPRGPALNTNAPTPQPSPQPSSTHLSQALAITQQSILALQRTQEQMAQLHRQYLEGQDAAQRTMAQLIDQQNQLLAASLGAPVAMPTFAPQPLAASLPARPVPAPMAPIAPIAPIAPVAPIVYAAPAPTPAAPVPNPSSEISSVLLAVVADKTGYPAEMLELTMSLDGDLGIDSIKRVEILSALQERLPDAPIVKPEDLGTLQTLGQIVDFLSKHAGAETFSAAPKGRAPESAQSTAPTTAPSTPTSEIAPILLAVVADKTGYPAEMLELTMSLDGDLGIDSIKRVEILSALQERLPDAPIVKPEDLGTLQTLGQIVEFLSKHAGAETFSAAPKGRASESQIDPASQSSHGSTEPQTRRLLRQCLTLTPLTSAASRKRLRLPSHTPVWITDDGDGLAAHLKAALEEQNIQGVIVPLDADPKDQAVAGLIVLSPAKIDAAYILSAFKLIQRTGPALRHAHATTGQHVLLTAITHLGGSFALTRDDEATPEPLSAALAGIIKTASHEWPQVACKVIDIEQPIRHKSELSEDLVDELLREGPIEVGMTSRGRVMTQLETIALDEATIASTAPINKEDVIVITGGARGVTAHVAIAIAQRYHCKLLLLGRSDAPTAEPDWLANLQDEGAIKKALASQVRPATPKAIEQAFRKAMANREVLTTLSAIEAAGGKAIYTSVDVRDANQVRAAIDNARKQHGPIRGIIHGAGVLADRLIEDKTEEQFSLVFGTKVDGFRALLAATKSDDLRTIIAFSSSTARFGRRGQVDYAAANEVLNKLSQEQAMTRKNCRVLSINWGPWDGGMVTPALKQLFASEGVGVIGLDDGAAYLADEIATPTNGPVEIVILREIGPREEGLGPREEKHSNSVLGPRPSSLGPALAIAFEREVSLDAMPMLRSHVIGGKAVLPMAIMIEWLAHAAIHDNPGLAFAGLRDLRVFKGFKVDGDGAVALTAYAGQPATQGEELIVPVELRHGTVLHARASVALVTALSRDTAKLSIPADTLAGGAALADLKPYDDGTLFHGGDLHAISRVLACDASWIAANVVAAPAPSTWMKQPIRSAWLADPMAIDGAFQLMIIWCAKQLGSCSLPTGLARYQQFARKFPAQGVQLISNITRHTAHEAVADIEFIDAKGALVARIEGYTCVVDGSLRQAFAHNQIQDSATV